MHKRKAHIHAYFRSILANIFLSFNHTQKTHEKGNRDNNFHDMTESYKAFLWFSAFINDYL